MPSIKRSCYLLDTRTICAIFRSITERRVLTALVFYYKDMLENVMMQRTQQSSAFLCHREALIGSQLDAAHAQLLEQLRPITFAETCRFLKIQSLEFREMWQKIVQKPRE